MVEGEGFEPSKAEPSDLQSDPFDRSGTPPFGLAADYVENMRVRQPFFTFNYSPKDPAEFKRFIAATASPRTIAATSLNARPMALPIQSASAREGWLST